MILAIESIILCGLFTLLILPAQYQNPLSQIASYPPAIRKRVESLPDYQESLQSKVQKQISRKILACFLIAAVLAMVSFLSGANTFSAAFWHTFALFSAVNLYDVVVLDLIIFCHSKKLRIKGTEDMTEEYQNPWHHIKGGLKGFGLGLMVSLLSGGLVAIFTLLL